MPPYRGRGVDWRALLGGRGGGGQAQHHRARHGGAQRVGDGVRAGITARCGAGQLGQVRGVGAGQLAERGLVLLDFTQDQVEFPVLLGLLAGLEEGSHVNTPGVDIFPVTAIKISVGFPLLPDSWPMINQFQPDHQSVSSFMALDGEFLPAGDVQVQVLPSAARVMVK